LISVQSSFWTLQGTGSLAGFGSFTCPVYSTGFYDWSVSILLSSWAPSDSQKKAGNIHMDNLHAILLMEGDFNVAMKILIGDRMIHSALEMG